MEPGIIGKWNQDDGDPGNNFFPLSHYLGDYDRNIKGDVDALWAEHDADGNDKLDKDECQGFIEAIQELMEAERKQNYDPDEFDDYFERFDED